MTGLFYVLIFSLAISSSQASTIGDDFKYVFDQMLSDIEYLTEKLKQFIDGELYQKKSEISNMAELAIQQIDLDDSLDHNCKEDVKKQIETHKSFSMSSFFTCSNLTDAMVETGSIIVFSLELTANLTENFNNIFSRLSSCDSDPFYEKPVCWTKAVLDVKDDVEKDMADISFYKTKVAKLASDITANIQYCAHPAVQHLKSAVEHAIGASENCKTQSPAH